MEQAYNKRTNVQVFYVGQLVGLQIDMDIPKLLREKVDDRYIVCMVVEKKHADSYRLWFEHGLIKGVVRTDQLVPWKSAHRFDFNAKDSLSALKEVAVATAAKLATQANSQPAQCNCRAGCKAQYCSCRKAGVQCTARCHAGTKCHNWGEH